MPALARLELVELACSALRAVGGEHRFLAALLGHIAAEQAPAVRVLVGFGAALNTNKARAVKLVLPPALPPALPPRRFVAHEVNKARP
jgi:hypothetical protein